LSKPCLRFNEARKCKTTVSS